MSDMTIGFAITGSFCTFKAVFPAVNLLVEHGYHVLPIMSENVYTTDTRFGRAADWVAQAEEVCGEKVIHTIAQAEPIGPKKLLDLLILAPCTGNTLQAGLRHIRYRADAGGEKPQAQRAARAHCGFDERRFGRRGGGHRAADEPERDVLCAVSAG